MTKCSSNNTSALESHMHLQPYVGLSADVVVCDAALASIFLFWANERLPYQSLRHDIVRRMPCIMYIPCKFDAILHTQKLSNT